MSKVKLLPCPFVKSHKAVVGWRWEGRFGDEYPHTTIGCDKCGFEISEYTRDEKTLERLAKKWNRRVAMKGADQ